MGDVCYDENNDPEEESFILSPKARTLIFFPANIYMWTSKPQAQELSRLTESFERLWHVNDKTYRKYALTTRSRVEATKMATEEAGKVELFKKASETETSKDIAVLNREISDLSPSLRRACRTLANTTLGKRREADVLEQYGRDYKLDIEYLGDRYSFIAAVSRDFLIEIRGRIDGKTMVADKRSIIEVKTRTRRLYHRITEQERVQLEMYLRMLKCDQGFLVEAYGTNLDVHSYFRNDMFYRDRITRLVEFSQRFIEFLSSENSRWRYVKMTEKERLIFVKEMIQGHREEQRRRRRREYSGQRSWSAIRNWRSGTSS